MHPFDSPSTRRLVELALDEDLGRGDVTSGSVVAADREARGVLVAREDLVVAGLPLVTLVAHAIDPGLRVTLAAHDGDQMRAGATLGTLAGNARAILAAERTLLNFLQRLSGVATLTRRFADAVAGTGARVADTRKTTPGFRALEKYAVACGGGQNHRFDLASGVLIKDNHLALSGSLREAVARARAGAPHGLKIEVEVDTAAQLEEALAVGCDIILLDNFSLAAVAAAVARVAAHGGTASRPLLEVSGGVTLDSIGALARTGVDLISVGALTHSARAVDIALDFVTEAGG